MFGANSVISAQICDKVKFMDAGNDNTTLAWKAEG